MYFCFSPKKVDLIVCTSYLQKQVQESVNLPKVTLQICGRIRISVLPSLALAELSEGCCPLMAVQFQRNTLPRPAKGQRLAAPAMLSQSPPGSPFVAHLLHVLCQLRAGQSLAPSSQALVLKP